MSLTRSSPIVDLCPKVAKALSTAWGKPVSLAEGVNIGRGRKHLHRFRVTAPHRSASPTSVVVKEAQLWEGDVYDPTASTGAVVQLCNDWTALAFLQELFKGEPLSPHFYAGNREHGFIVMQDLAGADPIDALQDSRTDVAMAQLRAMAQTLGRLHAGTIGLNDAFQQRRDRLGSRSGATDIHGYFYGHIWLYTALQPTLEILSLPMPAQVQSELQTLVDLLEKPGPLLAFTHGDPCPDNFIYQNGTALLLDFERSAFRHVCLDAVYGRMVFPTCWCANQIPETIWRQMEEVHRATLAKGCPAANDDQQYCQGIVAACAYWTLLMFQRYELPMLINTDSQWGLATLRQRVITRSQRFVAVTEQYGYLPALGGIIATISEQLATRWSLEEPTLPIFSAFPQGNQLSASELYSAISK